MILQNIILCIVLFILTITILINYNLSNNNEYISFLNGYWEADNTYCEISNIDKMIISIDINEKLLNVIIMIDGEITVNEDFDLYIESINKMKNNLYSLNILLNNDSEFEWNGKKIKCLLSIDKGYIELFDKNILLGKFYKDNIITNLLN